MVILSKAVLNGIFAGPYQEKFTHLKYKNPLLAEEIGKLPEFQDGISETESKALEQLCDLYAADRERFDKAFNQMNQIGIPEVRKYNSSLQALYWLFENGNYEIAEKVVTTFNLEELLHNSWGQNRIVMNLTLTDEQVIEIAIKHTTDKDLGPMHQSRKHVYSIYAKDYLHELDVDSKKEIMKFIRQKISLDYSMNKVRFTLKGRKLIRNAIIKEQSKGARWNDFQIVMDRINSPELLHYYINNFFTYIYDHRVCQSPRHTFKRKKGCCGCLARLGKYCLDSAGYETYARWLRGNRTMHEVLVLEENLSYYVVVDWAYSKCINVMSGPYKTKGEVDNFLKTITGPITYEENTYY